MIGSYPKVLSAEHKAIDPLRECKNVFVEEKIDGSQFSFSVDSDGKMSFRSRGAPVFPETAGGLFGAACKNILEISRRLCPDTVYIGECLSKPKHNTNVYERVPARNVILYDIRIDGERYAHRDVVESEAKNIGLECVPLYYVGPWPAKEALESFLSKSSVLGGKIEGIVIKDALRNTFGADGKPLVAKVVRDDFKERHKIEWRGVNNRGDFLEELAASYRSEVRWSKAAQHLAELGALEGSPRDIGPLIAEAQRDLGEECREEIAEKLLKWVLPQIIRKSTFGLPEWYKKRLGEK